MNQPTPSPATAPSTADCLFSLAAPRALEEELSDALRELPELVPGFTLVPAQGVGQRLQLASATEQVQGRARRVLIQIAMREADVEPLLQRLRANFGGAELSYWAVPLLHFGRFA